MDTDELDLIVENTYSDTPPENWDKGFESPLRLQKGENPFQVGGKWYLYIWDERVNDNAVFSYSDDMTISYSDFQEYIDRMKTPAHKVR